MSQAEHITSGRWGGTTEWGLYRSPSLPDASFCTAAGCVAIRDLGLKEVVLTYTPDRHVGDGIRKGQWEILGGHIEPMNPEDPDGCLLELPEHTVRREALEEGGFYVARMELFGYREIRNQPDSPYPLLSYYPFYWAISGEKLTQPTDPEQPASGTFTMDQVNSLVRHNLMDPIERDIVQLGLTAAAEALR